jgi:MmyB-like transcription regulator ligand binding domain
MSHAARDSTAANLRRRERRPVRRPSACRTPAPVRTALAGERLGERPPLAGREGGKRANDASELLDTDELHAGSAPVGELSIRDPDFRDSRTSHLVHGHGAASRTFDHPLAGTLSLDVHQLPVGTHPTCCSRPTRHRPPPPPAKRSASSSSHSPAPPPETGDSTDSGGHHGTRSLNGARWAASRSGRRVHSPLSGTRPPRTTGSLA